MAVLETNVKKAGPFELEDANDPERAKARSTIKVLEGLDLSQGCMNTPMEAILENITSSIRRGHPQVQPAGIKPQVVCLVGGGPSLETTEEELRQLVFEGAIVCTVNGAYNWCIERNLRPSAQVVIDARSFNKRFLEPEVPNCRYYIGSQAHPAVLISRKIKNSFLLLVSSPARAILWRRAPQDLPTIA